MTLPCPHHPDAESGTLGPTSPVEMWNVATERNEGIQMTLNFVV